MAFKRTRIPQGTYRLIPSRYPPVQTFETVATPEDFEAVMELEGWTNDRLVPERLRRLPRDQWVFGTPNSSIVMASFLHPGLGGSRFNGPALGAWYASFAIETAIAEVAHHLRREAVFTGRNLMRLNYRTYVADLDGDYIDLRGQASKHPELYDRQSYVQSQVFGEKQRAAGEAGIVFDSVRHAKGRNAVAYRPPNVRNVVMAQHFEVTAPLSGKVVARTLG